jgi:hypothetical protein
MDRLVRLLLLRLPIYGAQTTRVDRVSRKEEKTKQDGKVSKITAKTGASGRELNREERRGCDTFRAVTTLHAVPYLSYATYVQS